MAIRASSDNLSLDYPADASAAMAPVADFAEVWAHRDSLRQACTRMIGDAARAEDLVQETFLSALKSQRRLERRESMGPWLATVAKRRSIDELRGRRRLAVVPTPPEPEPTILDDPAEQFLSQELVGQLRAAIGDLTVRERQLLLRQATYGLSLSELAAEEETSIASVRSVLTRARHKVRMSLERGGALGVLPLPRWLLSLRDRTTRWLLLWEPTLPSLTGAGAQVANAIVAIVAAVAMLLGGAGNGLGPDESLVMIGTDRGAPSVDGVPGDGAAIPSSAAPSGGGGSGAVHSTPTQAVTVGSAIPTGPLPLPPLPPDHHTNPDKTSPDVFAESETGGHVYALGPHPGNFNRTAMFRSTDYGTTWDRVHAFDYNVNGRIVLPPTYPAQPTIFIATTAYLLRSDNAGGSFLPVAPARGPHSVMISPDFDVDGRMLIAGTPFLAYDVTDGTLEPMEASAGPLNSSGLSLAKAATYATDGALLLGGTTRNSAGKATSAVYRCTPASCGPPVALPVGASAPVLLRLASGTIVTYETQAQRVPVLYRSGDDGASFETLALPPHLDPKSLIVGPDGEIIVGGWRFSGGDSGIYRSTDEGDTWTSLPPDPDFPLGSTAMIKLSTDALLATPYPSGGGIRCSHDGGHTWARRC